MGSEKLGNRERILNRAQKSVEARAVGDGQAGRRLAAPDFLALLPQVPLIDVRSPAEFAQGHIPGAINLPLFTDAERAEIGTLYKQQGREAAVLRGLAVTGPKLALLAEAALSLCPPPSPSALPDLPAPQPGNERTIALHCWRGGMRSGSVAWLFQTAGLVPHVLAGGYKSFRRFVLEYLEQPQPLRVLGGKTGAGKTHTLAAMRALGSQVVDLEGLAHHRGSAFGAYAGQEQPTSEQFENLLAVALMRCDPSRPIWVEDESENLGRVNLPRTFFAQLKAAPLAVLETPEQDRLARVLEEYGELPPALMEDNLNRIQKRLGGLAHKEALACLARNDLPGLARILLDYYDRAYARHLEKRPAAAVIRAEGPEQAAAYLSGLEQRGVP